MHHFAETRPFIRAVAAVLLVALLVVAWPAQAGTKYERERHLRYELARLPVEHGVAYAKLQDAIAEARHLNGAAIWLDRKIHERSAWLGVARARARKLFASERIESRHLAIARQVLADERRIVIGGAIAAYAERSASATAVEALLTVGEQPELAAASAVIGMVVEGSDAGVDDALDEARAVRRRHAAVRAKRLEADGLRDRIAESRAQLQTRRNEVGKLRWHAHRRVSALKTAVNAMRYQAGILRAELDWLVSTPASLEVELAGHHRGQPKRQAKPRTLGSPLPGVGVNSNFGPRMHPITGSAGWHTGIDFAAPAGTPIRAAAGGRIFSATGRGGYGLTVVIDHGKATATLYAHMSRMAVDAGDKVKRGQVIGFVGSTGFSTGPHVHFEVRQYGRPDNPFNWL